MLSATIVLLYAASSALLLISAAYVFLRAPHSRLNRSFALTTLSLLAWVGTLFLYDRARFADNALLLLGRANFAAVVLAVFAAYRFVRAVAGVPVRTDQERLLFLESMSLCVVTLATPLVDRVEIVGSGGLHSTVYGVLFFAYLLHVVWYLAAALVTAFRQRSRSHEPAVRDQLLLIGIGTLATGLVALVTNAVLPYAYHDFAYADYGVLSSLFFLLAIAYAVARHRLFDIRLLIRRTLVYGLLLSLALAAYSSVVALVTDRLTGDSANSVTRFGVLAIAFSFDPVRRYFEHRIDKLLFRDKPE